MQGRDKLLETIDGVTILKRTVLMALAANLGPVLVGLAPENKQRRKALEDLDVAIVEVGDADEGMAATLRAGARAALTEINATHENAGDDEYQGMMVLLPDMPEITENDLKKMDITFQSRGGTAVRAVTEDGKPGHPTLFPDHILRDFDSLTGDKGAASMFEGSRLAICTLAGNRAHRDLDTPEDWTEWRAQTGHAD